MASWRRSIELAISRPETPDSVHLSPRPKEGLRNGGPRRAPHRADPVHTCAADAAHAPRPPITSRPSARRALGGLAGQRPAAVRTQPTIPSKTTQPHRTERRDGPRGSVASIVHLPREQNETVFQLGTHGAQHDYQAEPPLSDQVRLQTSRSKSSTSSDLERCGHHFASYASNGPEMPA